MQYLWLRHEYSDMKFVCPNTFYYQEYLTHNLGKLPIELSQFLAKHGWVLLLCHGGSISPQPELEPNGIIREQQI